MRLYLPRVEARLRGITALKALTVNEGYSFYREDPINLGIPDYKTFRQQQNKSSKTARLCRQILIGAAHISVSGHIRISQATSKTSPRVATRWPRRLLGP